LKRANALTSTNVDTTTRRIAVRACRIMTPLLDTRPHRDNAAMMTMPTTTDAHDHHDPPGGTESIFTADRAPNALAASLLLPEAPA